MSIVVVLPHAHTIDVVCGRGGHATSHPGKVIGATFSFTVGRESVSYICTWGADLYTVKPSFCPEYLDLLSIPSESDKHDFVPSR